MICPKCFEKTRDCECTENQVTVSTERRVPAGSDSCPAHGWPALRWTAEKPAAAGWWWVGSDIFKAVLKVEKSFVTGNLAVFEDGKWHDVDSDYFGACRWAGPLPEPESASDAPTTANDKLTHGGENQ